MNTSTSISKAPFITLENESVTIAFPKKQYTFAIPDIQKIHISKKRTGYISLVVGNLLDMHDMHYYLCVKESDGTDNRIPINRLQRYYCLKLIGLLRQSKAETPDFV